MSQNKMSEKARAKQLLDDFDEYNSQAWALIKDITKNDFTRSSLVSFATLVSFLTHKKMRRDYAKQKELVIMSFEENYDEIY